MGRPPRDEVAEGERQRRILQVAGRLFAQRGFAAVSLGEIADEVGVTKAAIYHHFASKDDLYAEVVSSTLEAIAEAIRSVVAMPRSTTEKITLLTRIAVLEVAADADLDSMMRDVAEHLTSAQRERIAAAHRSLDEAYDALMRAGIAAGELRPNDPRLLGHAFQHLLSGFVGRAGAEAGFQGRSETAAAVVDLFLHGAAVPGRDPTPANTPQPERPRQ